MQRLHPHVVFENERENMTIEKIKFSAFDGLADRTIYVKKIYGMTAEGIYFIISKQIKNRNNDTMCQ